MLNLEEFIVPISYGLTALLMILIGNKIYKNVKGGMWVGGGYVSKAVGFVIFIVVAYFTGKIFSPVRGFFVNLMDSPGGIIWVPLMAYIAFVLFDAIFYSE